MRETKDQVIVHDTPYGPWLLGSAFVVSGSIVLSIPLLSASWSAFTFWQRAAVLAIGTAHLLGGAYSAWVHVATETTFSRSGGEGRHAVRRMLGRAHAASFDTAQARGIEIETHRDNDGDALYRIRLWLSDSRVLALQQFGTRGRDHVENIGNILRGALRLEGIEA